MNSSVSFFSLNVRGLRDNVKRRAVFCYLEGVGFDFCFLQEAHLRDGGDVCRFKREWDKGESFWGIGGVHSTGVGILCGHREVKIENTFVIMQGRVLGIDVKFREARYRLIGVYGPQVAAYRREMVDCLAPLCVTNRHLVIGGDFNIDLGVGGDSSAGAISGLMACHGLVDGGLHTTPAMVGPTWRNSRGVARRLDYIFVSRSLGQLSGRLLPVFFTDHDGVFLQVGPPVCLFGRGYWKLDRDILEEQAFVDAFFCFFRRLDGLRSMCEGVLEWWDLVKGRIRAFIIGYCRRKKREERREVDRIQRLIELEYEAGNLGGSIDWERFAALKAQLRELQEQKARAFLERAHSGFLEHNETCSAMFFKSVRARQSRKVMKGVREENGSIVSKPEEMVRVTTDHFQGLFKEREIDVEQGNVFLEHLSRRLPEDIRDVMEAQISLEEVESALRRMGKGKVPGMDGLPAEFYLKFWGILGPVVLKVLKAILETGVPGGSMAVGVLSLLYKKGEATDLGNWRPLTMLCVDYKILAKVLADRLRTALPYVVHEDQTCGVEGRSIRWNLQLIRDSIAWVEDRGLPLMVAALDQAKAFDRVNRYFLFRVLGRLGFGEKFIGWIRTLYVGAGCRVSVNSHLGDVFDLSSGVRQGCPLSALLFVLYMEPLGAAIRADTGVEGLLIPGSGGLRVKMTQYADDTSLLLCKDSCLTRSLAIFGDFTRASGAVLNHAKSSVKFFGRWRGRTDVPGGLSLCEGALRILGVHFETSGSATLNWNMRIAVVQRKLAMWKARYLSFMGKVLVLKVDVLPSLLYVAYIYPLPACLRRPLVRLVFQFMWSGRCEWVARARMICPIGEGGRGVPHFPLKLDAIFVSFLLTELARPVIHPSGYLLRVFFSYKARSVMVWSNAGPRAEQLPWHFGHAAKWLRAHPEVEVARVGLDHRHLYEEVRQAGSPAPVAGISSVVWEGVQARGLDNRLKDLNWLGLHKCLPVRAILYRYSLVQSPTCPRSSCGREETVRHAFWDCAFAGLVWARARVMLGVVRSDFVVTWARLERGVGRAKGTDRDRFLLWLLMSLFKKGLWEARQNLVKTGRDWGVEGIVRRVEGDLRGKMKREERKWGKHAARERWKGGLGLGVLE
uniref:Reverse transcriptase domain-containing protein n=1 Tax=Oncorhynchus mykiss TaxID=8022 RepID=A0A8K9V1F6_ONCMY